VLDGFWMWSPSPLDALEGRAQKLFAEAAERLAPLLVSLVEEECHVLHADLHQGNYRFAPGHDVGVIDFDDCALGHPAQDIVICWYYLQRFGPRYESLTQAFREGYMSVAPWPTRLDDGLAEALLTWRSLALCASVLAHPNKKLREHGRALLPTWTARCEHWLSMS